MAKEYDNSNSGSIWRNERKQEPNHADYQSPYKKPFNVKCPHCGNTVWFNLSAWVKEWKDATTNAVKKFFSCKVTPCNQDGTKFEAPQSPAQQQPAKDLPADIPF